MEDVLFLKSIMVDKPYGGQKIQKRFGFTEALDRKVGEYWAISAHPNGMSRIAQGPYAGQTLKEVYENHRELFADDPHERFPLLIKINEINRPVSVQVHPDDAYAMEHENDSGKAELNIFFDVEPGTKLIRGHNAKTREELRQGIEAGDWDHLLRRIPVKDNDFTYTPPGTIHGIEGKLMMAEVQQSSDVTYRLYDYDRTDANGKKRPLHIEQAIAVTTVPFQEPEVHPTVRHENGNTITRYVSVPTFTVTRYEVTNSVTVDNPTYSCVLLLSGSGTLKVNGSTEDIRAGQGMIITANAKTFQLSGKMDVLVSRV
ncbi:MAG: type I phosphomannose isomerase catalytic subunit [Catenisphaera adipataccumulans]|jgi:mannose-6-phosphate isomerase|uniref:type I phosphomannose isomerase catalytic subunit n=1 Tax=Catenisphaera adipataccumulans TaxID=700500 RepID=UPI003D8E1A90